MEVKKACLGPGEHGFAFRVELFQGEKLVEVLETDQQEEVIHLANLHCNFFPGRTKNLPGS